MTDDRRIVTMVGHSYVSRLNRALRHQYGLAPNYDLPDFRATHLSIPGGNLQAFRRVPFIQTISQSKPDILLVQMGGNDISTLEDNSLTVAVQIYTLSQTYLRLSGAACIYICSLLGQFQTLF